MNRSVKNLVQLIGLVCRKSKLFEHGGREVVRLLLEVDESPEAGE